MKLVIGSDHAGFPMKADILAFLKEKGLPTPPWLTEKREAISVPFE